MAKKVLVIDDDIAITETMKVLLGAVGYEAETASDGDEGLDKARRLRPDLILLDLLLPRHDGYEIYKILRAEENTKNTPIIMLSSFSEKPEAADGSQSDLPADMFVAKPIDPGKLLEKIKKLVS